MKKTLLIISLLTCFAIAGKAQYKTNVIGVKLGPSLDWVSPGSADVERIGMGLGFDVGVVAEHYFTPNIAFASGLEFYLTQTHYKFTDSRIVENFLEEALVPVDRTARASYLEVPLKAKVKMEIIDSWQAYVEAGIGLGMNLRDYGRDEFNFYGVAYADESYKDYSYQYRLLQASVLFGLGVEFEINRSLSLFAQLSAHHSLSNAFIREMEKQTGSNLKMNFVGLEIGVLH